MTKKKKEPTSKLDTQIVLAKRKIKFYLGVALVTLGVIIGVVVYGKKQPDYVKKNVVNQYVCKIVGSVPDEDILALECLTK
jgi:hypothetical protein